MKNDPRAFAAVFAHGISQVIKAAFVEIGLGVPVEFDFDQVFQVENYIFRIHITSRKKVLDVHEP